MGRKIIYSPDYLEFEENSNERIREKLRYATTILENVPCSINEICQEIS